MFNVARPIKDDGHDFHYVQRGLPAEKNIQKRKKSRRQTVEWEAVTKGTNQIVITSLAAFSGMDKCGSCVQLHRWSECVFANWKGAKWLCFQKINGGEINVERQIKLSLHFLMDGGWFGARQEMVFWGGFWANKMMPIYCSIKLFLCSNWLHFVSDFDVFLFLWRPRDHYPLHCAQSKPKVGTPSRTADFILWNMCSHKRNFSFSCIAGKFTFKLHFISFFAQQPSSTVSTPLSLKP